MSALVLATALGLAACGGDDDKPTGSTSDATEDSGESDPTDAGGDPVTTAESDTSAQDDGGSGGSCTVNVEGEATDSWTSSGGISALNMGYWLGDDNPISNEGFYWIVNCQGSGTSALNLLAADGVTEADIPFGPKTLTVRVNFDDPEGELQQLFVLEGSDVVWELEAPGEVDITAFDDEHIAGTFELRYHNGLASVLGEPDQHITVSGEFDYDNPNVG